MSELLEQVTNYARENPGIVACACITVLLIGITQIVLKAPASSSDGKGVLTEDYTKYALIEKREVSHNTRIFRFALPQSSDKLGLPLGRHIILNAIIDESEVRRPYTPITSDKLTDGYFELLIKVYPTPHGKMSRYLDSLTPGKDFINVKGPSGRFVANKLDTYNKISMVCGGTGITPMWQIIINVLIENCHQNINSINLIFANVNYDDILLKNELDELATKFSHKFSVYFVLNNKPNHQWNGGVGFVSKDMLSKQFGPPHHDNLVLMCGPPPMNKAMKGHLDDIGFKDEHIFKF